MKILIIGGGPVGCYAGFLLAKKGHYVEIYENHPSVGSPIQCTGILTSSFDQFKLPMDNYLVNTIDRIEVNSPNKRVEIKQKDYIVCRTKFDQYLASLAKKEGVKIFTSHSFKRKEGDCLIIYNSKEKKDISIKPDLVIAADGPLSPTAKAYGFYSKLRENFFGVQATVEGKFAGKTIRTFFGNEVCPGLFAWITPESDKIARVGLATKERSKHFFDKFMQDHNFKATAMQAGTIPVYEPSQELVKENCFVIGDAATIVKATTLGGIVPAMQQVEILVKNLDNVKKYKKELKPLLREMRLHRYVHKTMEKFSDNDWDKLVSYVAQPKVQKVFESYTRDNPIPLVTKALLKEPRFLLFGKYLF